MKYSFALAVVFAGLAAAQSTTGSAALPIPTSDIDPCILKCVTDSASTAGCSSIADTSCICTSDKFLTAATGCITTSCPDKAAQAIALQSQLCDASSSSSQSASQSSTSSVASSTATAPATSGSASSSITSRASSVAGSASSHASSVAGSASSVITSLSSAAASATTSPNAAVGSPVFNFGTTGVWAAVALGGAAIAQLAL